MTSEKIHHGEHYRALLDKIGTKQAVLTDALSVQPSRVSKLLKSEYIRVHQRAAIEKALLPEAQSRGIEFESLLTYDERVTYGLEPQGSAQVEEPATRYTPKRPNVQHVLLTFEDGELREIRKPENDQEVRAMLAEMKARIGEVMEELIELRRGQS